MFIIYYGLFINDGNIATLQVTLYNRYIIYERCMNIII